MAGPAARRGLPAPVPSTLPPATATCMFLFVLLYLALVIVRPQEYPALVDWGVPVLQITLGGAFLLWILGARKDFGAPQFPLLFAFLLVLMLSLAVNGWLGGTLDQLTRFGPVVAAFVLVAHAITSHRRARIVMATLVLCTLVPAIHGIDQKAKGIGWTGVGLMSAVSPRIRPRLAMLLPMTLPRARSPCPVQPARTPTITSGAEVP